MGLLKKMMKRKEKKHDSFEELLNEKISEKGQYVDPYAHLSDEEYLKMKFEEMERNNEVFELMQKVGKPTEGVSWDNDDFDMSIYDTPRYGSSVPLYDNSIDPAHEVDRRYYEYDMHDGVLDGNSDPNF